MSEKEQFEEETKVIKALKKQGAIHDCIEAGCEFDPEGNKLPKPGKPSIRPPLDKKIQELKDKYFPSAVEEDE